MIQSIKRKSVDLKHNDLYYYIDSDNKVKVDRFTFTNEEDQLRWCYYNSFKTKEEAEKERDIRQIWFELREFAKERNVNHIKEGEGYACEISGVKFKWTPDWRDAHDKFGDRLKLLNF